MSAKWRKARGLSFAKSDAETPIPSRNTDQIVETQANYNTEDQVLAYYQGGNATMMIEDSSTLPVQHEYFHTEAEGITPDQRQFAGPGNSTYNMIDREVDGQRGRIDILPYSTGVTASDSVENFALTGEQAIIRRGRNPSDTGPVGTADSNGILALQYAQQVNQYFPNERSQSDLVRSV